MATLFADLVRDVTDLVRNEFALARTELAEKCDSVTGAIVLLTVGTLVSFAAILAALRTVVFLLAALIGEAAAGLVVGAAVLLPAMALVIWGRRRLKAEALTPRRTIAALHHEEDRR
ncbi:MAG: phage holin family protein [Alphaproteobacteria bacterium]